MLTVMWKIGPDNEEIYVAPSISLRPKREAQDEVERAKLDCNGDRHIAFQAFTVVQDGGIQMHRTVISRGEVFVMNSEGNTVASYRFNEGNRA